MANLETRIRPEIESVLRTLRRKIRWYVVLEGTALVVCLLCVLFWISLGLDWAYFRLSHLELPRWFRALFVVGTVCLFAATFLAWVALRSLRSMRTKALALVLERRFPELDDRLITAVELSESTSGRESPLTAAMLSRTVEDVARVSRKLDVGSVFEKRPLRRAVIVAAVLIASILGFAFVNQEAMARWQRGYLGLADEYWNRETVLDVKIVVQPGDRIRQFRDGEYKHPRGGDLTLLVEVPEGTRPDGREWKVPERVQLAYTLDGGRGSGTLYLSRFGDRQFRHSMAGLMDGMTFRVHGGDYTNRRPYRVTVVDPPRIDQVLLDCNYPQYTGLNGRGQNDRRVQGTQISLPLETAFLMRATGNKPLVNVRLEYGPVELTFGDFEPSARAATREPSGHDANSDRPPRTWKATLRVKHEDRPDEVIPLADAAAQKFFSPDRRTFHVPFVMTSRDPGETYLAESARGDGFGRPLVLPPDTLIRIYLEDSDEILSADPTRLTINGIVDQPPTVETRLTGIGSSVTRKASIPIKGLITDDYGLAGARFEYRVGEAEELQPRSFRHQPEGTPREFKLQQSADEEVERFDVLPLDLAEGQTLTLTVFAQDGDNLNGPHESRGERYTFKIVSQEELLSILYSKEINLRQRFEQIIKEVEDTRADLILHGTKVEQIKEMKAAGGDLQEIEQLQTAVQVSAERALHQVRKNTSETAVVEQGFADILEELVNNAVHTRQMVDRIDGLIVKPLHGIVTVDFPSVDGAIGVFKLANEKGNDPTSAIDESVEQINVMLEHMQKVLAEMEDLAKFHEAISKLKAIIEDSQQLKQQTEDERKRSIINKVRDLGLDE